MPAKAEPTQAFVIARGASTVPNPNPTAPRPSPCYQSRSPPNMSIQTKATIASFGGKLLKLTHNATTTSCEMGFNLFLPPQATLNPLHKVPLLIYLAGLTCTGDNGAEKGFFQHKASEKGIAVLYPDTSPREFDDISSCCTTTRTFTSTFQSLAIFIWEDNLC